CAHTPRLSGTGAPQPFLQGHWYGCADPASVFFAGSFHSGEVNGALACVQHPALTDKPTQRCNFLRYA
ncbi:MAG: hypothetical protein ACK6A5_04985, partial [Flavobacteriales bacterium]